MKTNNYLYLQVILTVVILLFFKNAKGYGKSDTTQLLNYIKRENTSGITFKGFPQREQLLTKTSIDFEELFAGSAKYQFTTSFWNLEIYKQEIAMFNFETGFLAGRGNLRDSSFVEEIIADHTIMGWRSNAAVNYSSRFYYDLNNYTLVELNAWGRFDLYNEKAKGTVIDSLFIESNYDVNDTKNKLRFGFQAKAGWGFGRLNPVNHLMVAEFLMDKYYTGRLFSEIELTKLAKQIGKIKNRRSMNSRNLTEKEVEELAAFLRSNYMLKNPGTINTDWVLGEFQPRFDGTRLELGPFFNYYNREPDFVYGGFAKLEQSKYINKSRNRNLCATLNYSRYKKQNWLVLEADLGWSFYHNLKSYFDLGFKYVPGTVVHDINDIEPISHNFIPYVEYFTQLNSASRISLAFAWRVADGEQFMQSGPEFSLSIYRSRY
jgi:hypothetical protein